jgi:hypothetical protein
VEVVDAEPLAAGSDRAAIPGGDGDSPVEVVGLVVNLGG